jgi:hypothetical protein
MLKLIPFLLYCGLLFGQVSGGELVPGFSVSNQMDVEGRHLEAGMSMADAMTALGSGAKVFMKPKHTSTEKLLAENARAEALAPMMPGVTEFGRRMAEACGDCWIGSLVKRLGKHDQVRVALMGPDRDSLRVWALFLDHDNALAQRWRSQFMADLKQQATYFVTEDGTYRVSRVLNTVRIERVK